MQSKRIAVVGSGISGLSAAWLLTRNGHSVTLFEKEAKAGGHTLTDSSVHGRELWTDVEVFNLTTYPNLVGFLECLNVDTEPSDMSFGLSLDRGRFEWASHGLDSIFAQRKNLFDPHFWLMIYHVIRFGQKAPEVLFEKHASVYRRMTLGEYIDREGYGTYFKEYYLLPMCAAVWSVSFETALQFPVRALVRFWINHHLLDLFQRPVWRVVKGRSINYVNKVLEELTDVRLGCEVAGVTTDGGRTFVRIASGEEEEFDVVVMATHSNLTLKILGTTASPEEKEIFESIPYQENDVYLHTDTSLMPRLRSAWASWSFVGTSSAAHNKSSVCVSYWLNRLQNLNATVPPLFVTLNPPNGLPKPESIIKRLTLEHPIFKMEGIEAQDKLETIQGVRGIYYVGAWCGYGFHEDGIRSSVSVVRRLGGTIPWTPHSPSPKSSLLDSFWMTTFDAFARRGIQGGRLRFILPNGSELLYGDGNTDPVNRDDWRNAPRLSATVRVFDLALFKKIVFRTDTGLAEGYMDEDFVVDDVGALMAIAAVNALSLTHHTKALGIWAYCGEWLMFLAKSMRGNTLKGSRDNIKKHYDIGNEYYKLFLDPSMTYSSGLYTPSSTLHDAQLGKLDEAIRLLDIKEEDHVLEIGCGWGSFAIRAVQRTGCRVTGLTLSQEQLKEGLERVKASGLDHLITLLFCDYRHCKGNGVFDKVVSIEMIEAVGHEHLDTYFHTIGRVVKPGGKVFIQAITVPDDRYAAYCASSDFIREHVFPGGHLPCMDAISSFAAVYGMSITSASDIGYDYAVTLRQWRKNWVMNRPQLLDAGCDPRFHRMFEMYFAYCEAGFDAAHIQNYQVMMQKTPIAAEREPAEETQTADHCTQALLAIYFFLAGVMVTNRPYMWLVPLASSGLVLLFAFCKTTASVFRFYREMNGTERVWWSTTVVRCFYGLFMGVLSALHVMLYGIHSVGHGKSAWELMVYCSPVCITLGFCGFQVWNIVYHRLYTSRPLLLIRYTVLLILLGIVAFKVEQVGLIAFLLLSEWNAFFEQLIGTLISSGVLSSSLMIRGVSVTEKITFVVFKLLLQLFVLFAMTAQSIAFQTQWSYWVTLSCVFSSTCINAKAVLSNGFRHFALRKEHTR